MRTAPRSLRTWLFLGLGGLAALAAVPVDASPVTLDQVQTVGGDTPQVTLQLSDAAEGSAVSAFTMSGPDRLVIDIADSEANPQISDFPGDGGVIRSGEVVTFDDGQGLITRVTLNLSGPVDHQIRSAGNQVIVSLSLRTAGDDPMAAALRNVTTGEAQGATVAESSTVAVTPDSAFIAADAPDRLSGPDALRGGVALASLDFQALDDVSRVVLGIRGSDNFTASQPQPNLIVVDIPGAFLPKSLGRVLDTSEFVSPVRMVRAYRTSSGARVAISLRKPVDFRTQTGPDGLIYVDVTVPEQMQLERAEAQQSYAAVSPSTSGQGLSNGSQSEVMIGSGGRTVDPQTAFGTGGGSSDPSQLLGMASGFNFDTSSAASTPFSGRRISLDFVNADIHSIFRLISHVSRLNIVSGDDVKGNVTVRMVDVPWDQALAAVLQAKGLGSQRFGNIVRVAPIETIKSEQQAALEAKRAQEELTELDLLVLPLNYMLASEMQAQVAPLVSARGSVQVDQTGNQLIIKETAERLAQVRELVRHLDKQTPQVLIEARVVEANSNYQRALGIQWGTELNASTSTGYSTGLFFPNSVGMAGGLSQAGGTQFYTAGQDSLMVDLGAESANSAMAFNLGSIPGLIDLDARLSAMETDGWGKVVSSPRVTTLDNKTAKISQGQRIPFMSASSGGTNVQFIEAALELSVTPHITSDAKVFLAVEVSNNRADFSQLVQGQPAIQIKEATTELLVADGDTTVLGGVFATEHSYSQDRVPGFSKLPLIGYLFKNSAEAVSRNELLVFITPHIVTRPTTGGGG